MKRALLLVGLAALAVAPALAQSATPEALVRELYAHYGVGQNEMRGFAPDLSAAKRYFDASLLRAWSRARRGSEPA